MKQNLIALSVVATFSMLAGFGAHADSDGNYPVKSPKCGADITIAAPDNGSGVFFNADCTTAFVLPPINGSVALTGILANDNLKQCSSLNLRMNTVKQMELHLNAMWKKITAADGSSADDGTDSGASNPIFGSGPIQGLPQPVATPAATASAPTADEVAALEAQIDTLELSAENAVGMWAKLEGATAQLTYKIEMSKLIADYQKLNQNLKINFVSMPLEIARMSFILKNDNGTPTLSQLSAVSSVQVPGLNDIQLGTDNIPPTGALVPKPSEDPGVGNAVFGSELSGQVVLTMMGACRFYDEPTDTIKSDLTGADLNAAVAANVQYTYGLEAFRKYHAEYNLANLVRHIQTMTTHGGIFSSKTANSIVEEQNSSDWFTFTDSSDDERFILDDEAIRKETKADLMDRVIKEISYGQVGQSTVVSTTAPQPDGASVAAKDLQKCPNLYCQAGAAVLEVLNAAFGSSNATATFIRNNDFTAKDDVTESRMLRYYGSFSFSDPATNK